MSQTESNAADPLEPRSILAILEQTLPEKESQTESESSEANVILHSREDALAALFHSIMVSVGFRLVGLGEEDSDDNKIERDSEGIIIGLPKGWNSQGPNSYAFRYRHPQSSLTFLVKCMRLANKFLIHGMGIEDNKTCTLEVISDDYTSSSIFPYTAEKQHSDPLANIFISTNRIKDLISIYKINILQRLIPGLHKPGYEETRTNTTASTQSERRQPQPVADDPLRIPTRQPPRFRPPIFDDPYGGDEPSSIYNNPLSIGRDDLDPLGSRPIIGPRFGGGAYEPLGGPSRGGGMYVGPNHPMFDTRTPNRGGIYGGPQTLPRGSVPPGARFDPIGPFGPQPGRFPGRGGRGTFGGEPDNDELPPPYKDNF
ncbi:5941_t:CDS:2 [Gigaspora rosea]|nr:5941_t:CDS:2 [Gigaspora rosea]